MEVKKYMHFAIMIFLTIGIGFINPVGQITEIGMKVLGVFVGVLYGWIFIDLIWPSVFGFVALGLTGATTIMGAFGTGFGNEQLLIILLTMVFAGALNEAGLTELIANWLLTKKIIRKSPWLLIAGIIICAGLGGLLGATMALIFLLWALVLKIADECNIDKKDPLLTFCILEIVLAAMGGGSVFSFHAGYLIYASFLDATIPAVPSMIFNAIGFYLPAIILFVFAKWVFHFDASKFILPESVIKEMENKKVTKGQRITLGVLLIYIALLLLPEFLPTAPGMALLKTIGVGGMSAIGLLVLAFVKIDNEKIIDLTGVFTRQTQWPLILLLAVTFPLADAIKSENCGIMVTIQQALAPIVSDMGLMWFMIFAMVLLGIVTQFTHNIVLGAMFIPLFCNLALQMGGESSMFIMWQMIYITLNCAYVTPAASMQAAMVHGHVAVNKKWAYLLGILVLLINWVVLAAMIPLGNMIF